MACGYWTEWTPQIFHWRLQLTQHNCWYTQKTAKFLFYPSVKLTRIGESVNSIRIDQPVLDLPIHQSV